MLLSAAALKAPEAAAAAADTAVITWQGKPTDVKAGEWILQLDAVAARAGENLQAVSDLISTRRKDVTVLDRIGNTDLALIRTPVDVGYDQLKASLRGLRGFGSLQPNFVYTVDAVPNDPRFGELYGLNNTGQSAGTVDADIDAPEAWNVSTGSSSIIVGIIDTGIAYDHPDLAANMWTNPGEVPGDNIDNDANGYIDDVHGYDFVGANDSNPYDDHGHGTHVAGTVSAVGNNGIGVAGVNWNAKVMALKFLDTSGGGSTADAVEAVNYATMMKNRGFNIPLTSNSWGGGGFDAALQNAIAAAGTAGMLFVAAAGNSGQNTDGVANYPSGYNLDNIIAVAATDRNDQRAGFSNYGATSVDIGAPGVDTLSTALWTTNDIWDPSGYVAISGTSMATPHVAGAAALAKSVVPAATYQQIRDAIYAGGDSIASMAGITTTGKRLNVNRALQILTAGGPVVVSHRPSGSSYDPIGNVQFDFHRPMNQGSFALSDVNSFTGPGGSNLLGALSGFTWIDSDTLQVNFSAQSTPGTYTIDIGPSILSATGQAMDQNANGVAGEASDRYTGSFSFLPSIIYTAATTPFEALDLVAGASGVTTALNAVDDGAASIALGANSFRFYNQTFTSVGVNSNGLITFGGLSTDYVNSNLMGSPAQASIAPLWDDWRTDTGTTPSDSAVLYKLDTANNRLIVEWNDVLSYNGIGGANPVTFQAVLQLNSGSNNGSIIFNYVDLNTGDVNYNNGASATVGIKDAGLQGPNRVLISQNTGNAMVAPGSAIRLAVPGGSNTWTGLADGVTFENAGNWSANAVPGVNDDAVIDLPASNPTITITAARSVRSITTNEALSVSATLTLAAASQFNANVTLAAALGGAGNATFAGVLNWTGGTMSGTGKTIIAAGGSLNINAGGSKSISRTIENQSGGQINWNASTLGSSSGVVVNKPGATTQLVSGAGGSVSFTAASATVVNEAGGTLTKTGDGTFTIASVFNNAGAVDVQGGVLALSGSGTQAGQFNVASPAQLKLQSAAKTFGAASSITGAGTLMVGSATHTVNGNVDVGTLAVTAGGLNFGGTLLRTSALNLSTGGVVKLTASGSRVLRTGGVSIDASSTLDLGDNDLVVDYTGASPAADVEAMVRSGYNVAGNWLGKRITSSSAAADANYALALAENAALALPFGTAQGGPLFAGQEVDLTTVLVKFTHRADLNLDGLVTPDDSAVFGGNYDGSGFACWATGDLNYDGLFTEDDSAIFGGAYDESLLQV